MLPPAVQPGPWFLTPSGVCLSPPSRCHFFVTQSRAGASFTPTPGACKNSAEVRAPICFLPGVSPALEDWVEAAGCPSCVAGGEELGCLGSAPLSDEMVLLMRPGRGPQGPGACAVEPRAYPRAS